MYTYICVVCGRPQNTNVNEHFKTMFARRQGKEFVVYFTLVNSSLSFSLRRDVGILRGVTIIRNALYLRNF